VNGEKNINPLRQKLLTDMQMNGASPLSPDSSTAAGNPKKI